MSFSEGFQEAFRRFEKRVDTSKFKNFTELGRAFAHWASYRWVGTYRQHSALAYEARERGFEDAYIPYSVHARARPSQERWSGAYKKRVRKARKVVMRKYKGVGKVRIKAINRYVGKGYSANKIQKRLKARGLGVRRKTLLKIVRQTRLKQERANTWKYTPKKYRKKRR
ncbi:MAG: hypothetical protein A2W22_06140 [Candidatus Levybacteria bacterium RBG_16_35_11]|nr:MAG: hypothetical protein A2W22_06140 [Candidatus Levybacteria bacterium RBG_16_35_11]